MKKMIWSLMLMAIVLPMAFGAQTSIIVTMLRTSPNPIEPGQYANVWFQIENRGDMDADNFVFTLDPKFPFSVYPGESASKYIGTLKMYEPVIVKYKIYVNDNAVEGWNDLNYKYSMTSFSNITVYGKSEVYVSYAPQIQVIDVSPKNIGVMKQAKINITLINLGHGEARHVKIELSPLQGGVTILGSNTVYFNSILPEGRKTASFDVMAPNSYGAESIPIIITYEDNNGTVETHTYGIGINVNGEPHIDVILKGVSDGSAELEVINDGPVGAKFVKATVSGKSNEDFYIGDLDSDDFDIIDVPLHGQGVQNITVNVMYQTPNLESRNSTHVIEVENKVSSRRMPWTWIILAVVVVALIVYKWVKK